MEGMGIALIVGIASLLLLFWAINLALLRWALRLNEIASTLHNIYVELKEVRVLIGAQIARQRQN